MTELGPEAELAEDSPAPNGTAPPAPLAPSVDGEGEPATLPLAYHQRTLIVGTTRSGKSVLTEMLVSELRCRVLVIDPKGEAVNYGARMTEAEVRAWFEADRPERRIARWVPARGVPKEYDAIYELAHRFRGPLVTVTDELYGPGTPQTAPQHLRLYLTQGGGLRHGHIGLTQRPANICMEARTEWDHLVVYSPPPDPVDTRKIAASANVDFDTLVAELRSVPKWGFVWIDRETGERLVSDPVPFDNRRVV